MRDDFSEDVKRALAHRVGDTCSNPDCQALTSGPRDDPAKAVNVGVAAHITAASSGGPRYDPSLSPEERRGADNGIWLCQNCAKLVDNDPSRFTAAVLREWKARAEALARSRVGKTAGSTTTRALRIELPQPVNPIGHHGSGAGYRRGWRFRVRLIAEGQPLDIIELELTEEGVGPWTIQEVFREAHPERVDFPISVERATEFWIDARSPRVSATKPEGVGRLTLRFRDHTQREGEAHEYVVADPPLR